MSSRRWMAWALPPAFTRWPDAVPKPDRSNPETPVNMKQLCRHSALFRKLSLPDHADRRSAGGQQSQIRICANAAVHPNSDSRSSSNIVLLVQKPLSPAQDPLQDPLEAAKIALAKTLRKVAGEGSLTAFKSFIHALLEFRCSCSCFVG